MGVAKKAKAHMVKDMNGNKRGSTRSSTTEHIRIHVEYTILLMSKCRTQHSIVLIHIFVYIQK